MPRLPIHIVLPVLLLPIACGPTPSAPTSTTTALVLGPGAPSGLAYSEPDAIYAQLRSIAPNAPSVNGTVTSWSVAPALPAGLVLDPSSGVISGAPLAQSRRNTFIVTASNANGSTSASIAIRVVPFHQEIDPHQGGNASSMHVASLAWGRLVDVYDLGASGLRTPVARNLVIGEDVQSDGVDYELETQVATQRQTLTVLHALGTPAFEQAYARLEQNLTPVPAVGTTGLPPFPMVPRDAALVLRLDDLLDASTIASDTVHVRVGTPPVSLFDLRVLADLNHGGYGDANGDGRLEFLPTRVILDLATSTLEASASSPPIAPNPYGLPPSVSTAVANVVLRIPTLADAPSGQTRVLANLAGHGLSTAGNGPVDLASPTQDVVRAMRSGGRTDVTGDAFNGYLRDQDAPTIVERSAGTIANVVPDPAGTNGVRGAFRVDFAFGVLPCARALRRGDVLSNGNRVMEVVEASAAPAGALVAGARVRMVAGFTPIAGDAELAGRYVQALDATRGACFVRFSSIASPPSVGVSPDSDVLVELSEPVDRATAGTHDGVFLARVASSPTAREIVPARVDVGADGATIALHPIVPLRHTVGSVEPYFASVVGGARGLLDRAGNAFQPGSFQSSFTLSPAASTRNTSGIVLRFDSADQLDNDGRPELRGQFLVDLARGTIRPRPVTHFSGTVDRTQPVPSIMTAFSPGVQAPLVPLGCKLQNVWRYCDAGFGLLDEATHNVDVEGLAWAPVGGNAVADQYAQFEIRLAHSKHLPDESLSAALLPLFPSSGLQVTYANNLVSSVEDPQRVVHPRARGYTVNPADRYQGATGTSFMPYPLNRGVPADQREYYTWRDTAIQAKGGALSAGAEMLIVIRALGLAQPAGVPYMPSQVPTIGLPLLMEFRTFPDGGALGLNAFDVSLATLSSSQPNFRAFSSGGIGTGGSPIVIDPDLASVAVGGFNPSSVPPGAGTLPVDDAFYLGEMQLVTRVSRAHTIFFALGGAATEIATPITWPPASAQPAGTQIDLAYRGATNVTGPANNASNDARTVDFYGDPRTSQLPPAGGTVTFAGNDATWKSSTAALSGASFLQARVSFVSNAATNATPELSVLGLGWRN